ncbi:TnsD family Tn7-like transposition protein [Deinococcus sp. AJ005]|uniref:TnsD family Tn7-like transposition protein n=1 Tax=Deinococcus sp. AJ005 TaxID=2652443 RepID=UPI00125CCB21|nr:TnsD family Tn7-like transposition protein [Deinococcus sp. AJ005]QFP76273.1 hypothetical protein DAAJ005_07275 [Deinococcus sp. AJ005]
MPNLIPDAYPDELLYSVLARYSSNLQITYTQTIRHVFSGKINKVGFRLPAHLSTLVENLPSWQDYSVEDLISQNTLFRYYTAFTVPDRQSEIMERMKGSGSGLPGFMGLTMSGIREQSWLHICPECVKADTERYGEPYWHTVHQAPGVLICPYHLDTALLQTSVSTSSKVSSSQILTVSELPPTKHVTAQIDQLGQIDHDILRDISTISLLLIQSQCNMPHQTWGTLKYREKITVLGLMSPGGMADRSGLKEMLMKYYSKSLLLLLGFKDMEDPWKRIAGLISPHAKRSHTLQHILMILFLKIPLDEFFSQPPSISRVIHPFGKGPWGCKNSLKNFRCLGKIREITLSYRNKSYLFKCESCGYTYAVLVKNSIEKTIVYDYGAIWIEELIKLVTESDRDKSYIADVLGISVTKLMKISKSLGSDRWDSPRYMRGIFARAERKEAVSGERRQQGRQKILNAITVEPNISRTQLATGPYKRHYEWLMRHDREWFDQHVPAPRRHVTDYARLAQKWHAMDVKTALEIPVLVRSLYSLDNERQKIRQITSHEIISHIDLRHGAFRTGKLPLTSAEIKKFSESLEDFHIRKLDHLAIRLMQDGKLISFPRFLESACIFGSYRTEKLMIVANTIYEKYVHSIRLVTIRAGKNIL